VRNILGKIQEGGSCGRKSRDGIEQQLYQTQRAGKTIDDDQKKGPRNL